MGALTLTRPRVAAIGSVVLVLLAGAVFVRMLGARSGMLGLLIVISMLDRFTYPFGSVDVRGEQLAALIGLGLVSYRVVTQSRGSELLRPSLIEVLLGVWFAISLISSVTAAPDVSRSVKGVGLLLVSCLGLVLPRRMIDKASAGEHVELAVKILLLALAAEGAYGTLTWFAHVFGFTISISPNEATGHLSAYGTLWEPNVFGALCAAGAVAWTWLGPRYFRFAWIGIALCLSGTVVSFTRAAWLAAVVVLALGFFGPLRVRASQKQFATGVVAAGLIAIAVLGAEHFRDYYVNVPVAGTTGTTGTTATQPANHGVAGLLGNWVDVLGRLDQINIAGADIKNHLLLGNGTASYGERHQANGAPEHIATLELAVLYETGVIGLLVFLAFGFAVARGSWRQRRNPIVAGLGMTTLVIVITTAATETTELMITWLLVGLLLMATDAAREQAQRSTSTTMSDRPTS